MNMYCVEKNFAWRAELENWKQPTLPLATIFFSTLNFITKHGYLNFFVPSFVEKFQDCKLTIWFLFRQIKVRMQLKFYKNLIPHYLKRNII